MKNILIALVAVALLVGYNCVVIVPQWYSAIVLKFGEIDRIGLEPGLHFIIPVVNTVEFFEKRLLILDEDPERFLTKEKKEVIVDFYVMWRVADVSNFYRATKGSIRQAEVLLKQRAISALRDEFGERTVQEVVVDERGQMMEKVRERFAGIPEELGIELIDMRTIQVDLPDRIRNSVFDRMRAERGRVAKDWRARGEEAAERIRATADREREFILALAYRKSETIRGQGDAEATDIYGEAYGKDKEFYNFYRSLNAYRNSFQGGDVMVLGTNEEFFKYFRLTEGGSTIDR
ncbi:MAG: protease modulator HflC [Candidatus Porifericomitaceae bacterium WSBS_2022_MAG_OTU9]